MRDMSLNGSPCSDSLKALIIEAGAYRVGIARAEAVPDEIMATYREWISRGWHGEMNYLEKYDDVRSDPRRLLDGAESIIVCAFPYYSPIKRQDGYARFARYALGDDYHEVLRRRLTPVCELLKERYGTESRICIDTAPLLERYWAMKSGVGFTGLNRQLIIPGAGSYFFLATIVTTAALTYDKPCEDDCGGCGRCVALCPGQALSPEGLDARRCESYLTIEYRGALPANRAATDRVYGCDVCADVCPHNAAPPVTTIPEFLPRPYLLSMTREEISRMTQDQFSTLFRRSAVKRTKLAGLQRNAATPPQNTDLRMK